MNDINLNDFEKKYEELSSIKSELESGKLTLAQSIEKYKIARNIYNELLKMLSFAEHEIENIDAKNNNDNFDFNDRTFPSQDILEESFVADSKNEHIETNEFSELPEFPY